MRTSPFVRLSDETGFQWFYVRFEELRINEYRILIINERIILPFFFIYTFNVIIYISQKLNY